MNTTKKPFIITLGTKITPLTPMTAKPTPKKNDRIFFLSVRDPYRIFFTLGFLHLIMGLLPWIHAAITKESFPSNFHLHYAGLGYFTSLIIGFTLTAIPRLVAAPFIPRSSWILLVALNVIALVGGLFSLTFYQFTLALFLLLGTILVTTRLLKNPIKNFAFLFIPIGMTVGAIGILLWTFPIGKILFIQNFLLLVTMGTGAYLLSVLIGVNPRNPFTPKHFFILISLLTLGLIADITTQFTFIGPTLRAITALTFGILQLNIQRFTKRDARQAKGLWIAYWNIILGFVAYAILPTAHTLHWLMIAGFVMLTYFMSIRVVFAHGGYSLTIEKTGKSLYWVLAFILFAAATRVTAHLMPSSYLHHLGYASLMLLTALTIWITTIYSKLLRVGPNGEH